MPLEDRDFKVWGGINIQEFSTCPPKPIETRLALYLIDVARGESKEFSRVNIAIEALAQRKIRRIGFGSKGKDTVFKVVIQWEEE